jgi:minichromosome maintenance protein 10
MGSESEDELEILAALAANNEEIAAENEKLNPQSLLRPRVTQLHSKPTPHNVGAGVIPVVNATSRPQVTARNPIISIARQQQQRQPPPQRQHTVEAFRRHDPTTTTNQLSTKSSFPDTDQGPIIERLFGLKIRNPRISSSQLSSQLDQIASIRLSQVVSFRKTTSTIDSNNSSWATVAVLGEKSPPRESSTGKPYSIWKLTDLDETMITVKLYGAAHTDHCNISVGSIVAIFDARPPDQEYNQSNKFFLRTFSSENVLELGISTEFGYCKSHTASGEPCRNPVNIKKCQFCPFHVQKEYKRLMPTRRNEFQGTVLSSAFRTMNNKKQLNWQAGDFGDADGSNANRQAQLNRLMQRKTAEQLQSTAKRAGNGSHGAKYVNAIANPSAAIAARETSEKLQQQRINAASNGVNTYANTNNDNNSINYNNDSHRQTSRQAIKPSQIPMPIAHHARVVMHEDLKVQQSVDARRWGATKKNRGRGGNSSHHLSSQQQREQTKRKHADEEEEEEEEENDDDDIELDGSEDAIINDPVRLMAIEKWKNKDIPNNSNSNSNLGRTTQQQQQQQQQQLSSSHSGYIPTGRPGFRTPVYSTGGQRVPLASTNAAVANNQQNKRAKGAATAAKKPGGGDSIDPFDAAFGTVIQKMQLNKALNKLPSGSMYKDAVEEDNHDQLHQMMGVFEAKDAMAQKMDSITKQTVTAYQCTSCNTLTEYRRADCGVHYKLVKKIQAIKKWWACEGCGYKFTTIGEKYPTKKCYKCQHPGANFKSMTMFNAPKEYGFEQSGVAFRDKMQSRGMEQKWVN